MPIVLLDGDILVSGNAIASSTECCCVYEPDIECPLRRADGSVVTALGGPWDAMIKIQCWGGSIFPGRARQVQNGVTVFDVEWERWSWYEYIAQTVDSNGVDAYGDQFEFKWFSTFQMQVPVVGQYYYDDSEGRWNISVSAYNPDRSFLDIHIKQIDRRRCILYGHVGVEYDYNPMTMAFPTAQELLQKITFNQTWRWQSVLQNGTLGSVSVVPVVGYTITYERGPGESIIPTSTLTNPVGPQPSVTITIL